MLLTLRQQLSRFSHILQSELFPILNPELGELSETARRLVAALELIPLSRFILLSQGWNGRPPRDRNAIARAFVAKAIYNLLRTSAHLLERLGSDEQLRSICGWKRGETLPHESTFSRAFAEFPQMELGTVRSSGTDTGNPARPADRPKHCARWHRGLKLAKHFRSPRSRRRRSQPQSGRVKSLKGKKLGPPKRWKGGKAPRRPASSRHTDTPAAEHAVGGNAEGHCRGATARSE